MRVLRINLRIAKTAASRRAVKAVEIAVLVAIRRGKKGNVDRHFTGDQ